MSDPQPPAGLTPALHVEPAPADGWAGADLSDDELVDDQFINDDPDSTRLPPEVPDGS